ncbi:PH domain-containing protein [Agromyces sp. NPDC056965]|uniref:PH domain-containing protein n=1 Tax=Agromyces sp. NPDC056965 TaxID=3345983 RepID=UPI00364283AC
MSVRDGDQEIEAQSTPEPARTVRITVTRADRQAMRRALVDAALSRRLRVVAAVILLISLAVGVFGLVQGDPAGLVLFGVVTTLALIFVIVVVLLRRAASKAVDQRMPLDSRFRIGVDADGVEVESVGGTSRLPWSSLSGAERGGDVVVLRGVDGKPVFFAPGRTVDDRALALIESGVRLSSTLRGSDG